MLYNWEWIVEPYIGRVQTRNFAFPKIITWSYIWKSIVPGAVDIMDMGRDDFDRSNIDIIEIASLDKFDTTKANLIIASHWHCDHVGGGFNNLKTLKDEMGGTIMCHYYDKPDVENMIGVGEVGAVFRDISSTECLSTVLPSAIRQSACKHCTAPDIQVERLL
jgi:hypothetical protein